AGPGRVVVGEDPDQVPVGRHDVVDLAGRGVDVVVVEARRGDRDLRAGGGEAAAEARVAVLQRLDAGDGGLDHHDARGLALLLDELANAPARLLAGLDVVGADEALGRRRHGGVGEDDLRAGRAGALDRGVERVRGVRREHDRVRAARDRVLDELDLLVDVGLGRRAEQPDLQTVVSARLPRPGEHRLPEGRVRRLDDDVDLLARRGAAGATAARR